MALNINIDNITLDILSTRLKHVVSPLNILKWLSNFKKEDIGFAIATISNMTVYTTNEIEEILNESFSELLESIPKEEHLIVLPIGEFGKSGSMMAYFFQKTDFFKNKKNKSKISLNATLDSIVLKPKIKYSLVLFDDFIGSGKTVRDYFNQYIFPKKEVFVDIYFVGIAAMKPAFLKTQPYFKKVIIPPANIFKKAFSDDASYFGYRKFQDQRKFSYDYGKDLVSPSIKKSNKTFRLDGLGNKKYLDALGYENSQALVSFAYGSPNNTLPIIWANRNDWFPLIPRFSSDKISAAKNFRKSILHELAILKEFGSQSIKDNFFSFEIKKGNKTFTSVNKIDFSIYAIIKLSRAGFIPISICQKLGILYKDYEEILAKGEDRGVFDSFGKLSPFGLQLYADAKRCIEKRKRSLENGSSNKYKIREINYLPKKFNGRS